MTVIRHVSSPKVVCDFSADSYLHQSLLEKSNHKLDSDLMRLRVQALSALRVAVATRELAGRSLCKLQIAILRILGSSSISLLTLFIEPAKQRRPDSFFNVVGTETD